MKATLSHVRILFETLGYLFALLVIAAVGFVWFQFARMADGPETDNVHPRDVQYIVNWADFGDAGIRIQEVVHSFESGRLLIGGDHSNAYCLKLSGDPLPIISTSSFMDPSPWMRGPLTESLYIEAIENVAFVTDEAPWFPSAEVLNTERYYLLFHRIEAFHNNVDATVLSAYDTEEKLLFHADISW